MFESGIRSGETGEASTDPVDVERPRICVGIATKGRPELLSAMLDNLERQTLQPAVIVVCCSIPEDIGDRVADGLIQVVYEVAGLPRQRNAILRAVPSNTHFVVFFDDDFYPHPCWLETVARVFADDPTISCITGHVVVDGILGPGLSPEEALASIAAHDPATTDWIIEDFSPYGCNMAYRCTAIEGLHFDEKLVLYGWLEDRDFGAMVARRGGRSIKLGGAFGAHLGVKRGRVPGTKFGYSQVANPFYMWLKGTITTYQMVRHISFNIIANFVGSFRPEPYVDRRGRLIGNFVAAFDLLRFRLTPERAASL